MLDQELVRSIRNWKKDGELGTNLGTIVHAVDSLSLDRLDKVGNILKSVTIDEWQTNTLKPLKVAILGNFTTNSLPNYLRPLLLQAGIWPEIYLSDFNQYMYQMMDATSELYAFQPDLVLCLLDEHVVFDELSEGWNAGDVADVCQRKVQQLHDLISMYEQRCSGLFVTNTVPLSKETHQMVIDYKSKAQLSHQWRQFQSDLLELSSKHKQVITLDLEILQQEAAGRGLFDPRLYYYASMNLSEELMGAIARETVKIARAVRGLGKKLLVLDADNTLWGGIIGDDGMNGIHLGDAAPGKIFVDFQKKIKHLSKQGVLLAINSKNEQANVLEVLNDHPDMQLRQGDFVIVCANWLPKPDNIQTMASTLNLGTDSFVFLDDNPFERNIVRELVPGVAVPELSEDPAYYVQTLLAGGWFNTVELTNEDLNRTQAYKEEAEREQFRSAVSSVDDYLQGLDIHVTLLPPLDLYLPRLTQINMRTNQFNMTTRRYQEAEMAEMAKSDEFLLMGFRSTDRFGDNGIVGSVIVEKVRDDQGESWWIRNFLMSCRVFSRSIETIVLQQVLKRAQEQGAREVFAEYIPTKKNVIVKDFYTRHHFAAFEEVDGVQIFRHDLHEIGEQPAWITLHTELEETV